MVSSSTRDLILAAATATFAQVGYAGARVDDIAARAGVNKAMLYYHVGNKRALYEAVLREVFAYIHGVLRRVAAASSDPAERLELVATEIATFAETSPDLPAVLFREVAAGGRNLDDDLLRELASVFTEIRAIYQAGERSGAFRATDPLVAHSAFVGSLFFLVGSKPLRTRLRSLMSAGPAADETAEALAAQFSGLLLDGLRVRERSSS